MQPTDGLPTCSPGRAPTRPGDPTDPTRSHSRRGPHAAPTTRRGPRTRWAHRPLQCRKAPTGRHCRLRRGRQPPADRSSVQSLVTCPGRPGSLDHRSLGRPGGQQGSGDPPAARCGKRTPGDYPRRGRGLFWGAPTLVGIEPTSMTALFCHNAADRSATSWHEALAPWQALEFVISDAAKGIASGLDRLARQRQGANDPTPLAPGLDLFHTAREARTVLFGAWRRAEAAWTHAETCDTLNRPGVAQTARAAWRQAVAMRRASGIGLAACGRRWTFSCGRSAEHEPASPGGDRRDVARSDWSGLEAGPNFLSDPRSTAFRPEHKHLAEGEPRVDWVRRWPATSKSGPERAAMSGQGPQDRPESSWRGPRPPRLPGSRRC